MSELKPTHPFIERSGRWSRSPFDTLTASWCSASIRFLFSGRLLRIRPGKNTERKDPENGGTPMLVWTITPEGTDSSEPLVVESGDAHPFREITLIEDGHVTLVDRPCFVQITLVDWASVFEVEAIVVESVSLNYIPWSFVVDYSATGRVLKATLLLRVTTKKGIIDRRLHILWVYCFHTRNRSPYSRILRCISCHCASSSTRPKRFVHPSN